MQQPTCEKCGKGFSSNSNMKRHAQKCGIVVEKERITCAGCGTSFTKGKIYMHTNSCLAYMRHENSNLKEEIARLKEEIARVRLEGVVEGMKNAPSKTTINNQVNNVVNLKLSDLSIRTIEPFTVETILSYFKSCEEDYMINKMDEGIVGFLDLFDDIVRKKEGDEVQRSYVCTDASRNKYSRVNVSRLWETDIGGLWVDKYVELVLIHYEARVAILSAKIIMYEDRIKRKPQEENKWQLRINSIKEQFEKHEQMGLCGNMNAKKIRALGAK